MDIQSLRISQGKRVVLEERDRETDGHSIVFFDANCKVWLAFVRWVQRKDETGYLIFKANSRSNLRQAGYPVEYRVAAKTLVVMNYSGEVVLGAQAVLVWLVKFLPCESLVCLLNPYIGSSQSIVVDSPFWSPIVVGKNKFSNTGLHLRWAY